MSITCKTTRSLAQLSISEFGRIQISAPLLNTLTFFHLESGVYSSRLHDGQIRSSRTNIDGYTEWLSDSTPQITVGWDWMLLPYGGYRISKIGSYFSNLQLVGESGEPLNSEASEHILEHFFESLNWTQKLEEFITHKYR